MERPKGLFFEEFAEGFTVESVGRTITEADVVSFAALSGDWNLMHTNAEYAKGTMFGQRVAHGLLVLSIATGLATRLGFMEETVKAFLGVDWKFRAPVYIGDTIRLRATVKSTRAMRRLGGGIVTFDVQVLKQDDTVVQRGTWEMLAASKDAVE